MGTNVQGHVEIQINKFGCHVLAYVTRLNKTSLRCQIDTQILQLPEHVVHQLIIMKHAFNYLMVLENTIKDRAPHLRTTISCWPIGHWYCTDGAALALTPTRLVRPKSVNRYPRS
jgi:hypothetical protein